MRKAHNNRKYVSNDIFVTTTSHPK